MSLAEAVKSALGPIIADRDNTAGEIDRLVVKREELNGLIRYLEEFDTNADPGHKYQCQREGCDQAFGTVAARHGHMTGHAKKDKAEAEAQRQADYEARKASKATAERVNAAAKTKADARITAAWHLEHDLPAPAGEELGIALPEPLAPPHDPPGPMPPPVEDEDIQGTGCAPTMGRFTPAPWPTSYDLLPPAAALIPTGLPPKPVDVDQARARAYDTPENEIKNQ